MRESQVTVCVLLYGDYDHLARRCVESILYGLAPATYQLRIGANQIGDATENYLRTVPPRSVAPAAVSIYRSAANIHKYPMMRQMVHDLASPIDTPYTMWFDDDSYITDLSGGWLDKVLAAMVGADMLGSLYHQTLRGNQGAWICDQPWYSGIRPDGKVVFATGGWWCIRTEVLKNYNWPIPELDHRGGDVMLGQLFRQQRLRLRQFRTGVAINADMSGKESMSPRRGFDSKPIGYDYKRSK